MTLKANTKGVIASFRKRTPAGRKRMELRVGYDAPYAVYVHEDLEANHPRGGTAKYLERPMRRLGRQMSQTVQRAILNKKGLEAGLMQAGRLLLEASQSLVPVDTGYLKSTGFVRVVR